MDEGASQTLLNACRTALLAASANTEVVLLDTAVTSVPGHEALVLGVFVDQVVSFYLRKRSVQSVESTDAAKYRNVKDSRSVTPTPIPASEWSDITVSLTGDYHQLVLKTGSTPPTKVELCMKFVSRSGT